MIRKNITLKGIAGAIGTVFLLSIGGVVSNIALVCILVFVLYPDEKTNGSHRLRP